VKKCLLESATWRAVFARHRVAFCRGRWSRIAGSTVTVERVLLGEWGCLGCTRQGDDAAADGNCDELPDTRAPSVSFLSNLPGILACGELAKEALGGGGALRGAFHHIFIYGRTRTCLSRRHLPGLAESNAPRRASSARTERSTSTRECETCRGDARRGLASW
jgi:hypothetical protein